MADSDLTPTEPAPWATYVRLRAEGQIPFQHCEGCGNNFFYPRVLCPRCGSVQLQWKHSAGLGTVYSQTFVPGRDGGGYYVLLVVLDDGFRVMASAFDESLEYPIGARVKGSVEEDSEKPDAEPKFMFERIEN